MFMPMSSQLHQPLHKTLSVAELDTNERTGSKDSFGTDVYSWHNKEIKPKMHRLEDLVF
jgi:hypothetical protein